MSHSVEILVLISLSVIMMNIVGHFYRCDNCFYCQNLAWDSLFFTSVFVMIKKAKEKIIVCLRHLLTSQKNLLRHVFYIFQRTFLEGDIKFGVPFLNAACIVDLFELEFSINLPSLLEINQTKRK